MLLMLLGYIGLQMLVLAMAVRTTKQLVKNLDR